MPGSVFAFDAIGTSWRITTTTPLPGQAREAVTERVARFDAAWSRFREDSLVARLARRPTGGGNVVRFPDEAGDLFRLYDQLAVATDGAVDPLVGRDLELLGYDATYSLTPDIADLTTRGDRPQWTRDVTRDGTTVTVREPVVLDIGAAGKGLLVDLIVELLDPHETGVLVVDAGGDLRHRGPDVRRVGLEDPTDPTRVLGVVPLRDTALCASAPGRRTWGEGLHHVLDGRTGRPTHGVLATWAIADTAALADGLATAAFFADPTTLATRFDAHVLRLRRDGHLEHDAAFPGELFT